VLVSPCDGIVVACGRIDDTTLVQAKGFTYRLEELLLDNELAARHRDGVYVTLRLTSTMYHRFHSPADARIDGVTYVAGDTWNVNPAALSRVAGLYCANERAVLPLELADGGSPLTLVAVAAILVGSIHLNVLGAPLHLAARGRRHVPASAAVVKGEELGYFHHGSTIVVLAGRPITLCDTVQQGALIRMGTPLLRDAGAACDREAGDGQ
jgi:phosphatidylserine decarboxylase